MALSLLRPSVGVSMSLLAGLTRGLVKPSTSTMERQLKTLLAERQSVVEAHAEAVAEARIETTQRCLREILRIVDALDNLDIQMSAYSKTRGSLSKHLHDLQEGISASRSLVDQVLNTLGARRIAPSRLDIFDSAFHSAVRVIEDPSLPSNTVYETLQPGLVHGDTVIRPAQVVINDVY